ncbi:MAG: serine/threonine protein kinase, partial [Planctomycetaceae bacterium]|nr:serine/threonine protein kinase [Planctomycetaceae bacterium]
MGSEPQVPDDSESAESPANAFEQSPLDTEAVDAEQSDADRTLLTELESATETLTAIGRYRIVRVLGQGSYGRVFEAVDESLQRPVAIKVLEGKSTSDDSDRWLAEARTLASLDHPGIVPVYDVGTTESGVRYIVSRLISGGNLREFRQQKPSVATVISIVVSIAEAAAFAHEKGFVHRDIKPANILMEADGRAFLADFGLAQHATEFGTGARFVGTPSYMSPEQARMEGHRVDGRSDIYS